MRLERPRSRPLEDWAVAGDGSCTRFTEVPGYEPSGLLLTDPRIVSVAGFEPAISPTPRARGTRLHYTLVKLLRAGSGSRTRTEPLLKRSSLPLDYTGIQRKQDESNVTR